MIRCAGIVAMCCAAFACAQSPPQKSDVQLKSVDLKNGSQVSTGVLAWDPNITGKRPAVLVVCDRSDDAVCRQRANRLAKLGYVALAISLNNDRKAALAQVESGFDALVGQALSAPHKVAAIGYGTGGTALLQLALGGADLAGVACVHSDLAIAIPKSTRLTSRILALMGTDDPLASIERLTAFESEMRAAKADWDVIRFGGVGGDYTNLRSKSYDVDADQRTQSAINQFLSEVIPTKRTFSPATKTAPATPQLRDIPDRALQVLKYVDEHDRAKDGYEGGRSFGNFERRLPASDAQGRRLRYREWDVNPLRPGRSRGAERLVTGSDGSAYYTDDHYETFKKIR